MPRVTLPRDTPVTDPCDPPFGLTKVETIYNPGLRTPSDVEPYICFNFVAEFVEFE